jgi:hypothetical protein
MRGRPALTANDAVNAGRAVEIRARPVLPRSPKRHQNPYPPSMPPST